MSEIASTPRESKAVDFAVPFERYAPKLFPGSSHAWALERIASWKPSARVLDVGVGSGVLGRELQQLGFSNLVGIEVDESTRDRASALGCYQRVVPSIEDSQVGDGYSHALLMDVIEHVADPQRLLTEVCGKICPGGTILISVPNVTHWALRVMLLFGYFRYAERGPLDRTHLRFFSKSVLTEVIEGIRRDPQSVPNSPSELELGEVVGSIVPLELMLPSWITASTPFRILRSFRIMLATEFPTVFGYQLLVEVRKRV
jgi:SAM-dependent methyltransferase